MCPARRQARRMTPALLDVAMQSAFQEKCSCTMAVRGLLDGGSVTLCRDIFRDINEDERNQAI